MAQITIEISDELVDKLADAVVLKTLQRQGLSPNVISNESGPTVGAAPAQPVSNQEPADPWGVQGTIPQTPQNAPQQTQQAPSYPASWPPAPNPQSAPQPQPAPSQQAPPPQAQSLAPNQRTVQTKNGALLVYTFSTAGAPNCMHGQPAALVEGVSQKNGKKWRSYWCALSADETTRKNQCEFKQWA